MIVAYFLFFSYSYFSQWWKNDKVESWRSGKMSDVEINVVEIVPFSALYYKIHTISILQVRKLVIQVQVQVQFTSGEE